MNPCIYVIQKAKLCEYALHFQNYSLFVTFPNTIPLALVLKGFNSVLIWKLFKCSTLFVPMER